MVTPDDFWNAVGPVGSRDREALARAKMPALYLRARDDAAREGVVRFSRELLDAFGRHDSHATTSSVLTDGGGKPDRRWELLRDLETARASVDLDFAPEPPFSIDYDRAPRVWADLAGLLLPHGWVTVRFDDRLSLAAVVAELRRSWPALRAAGLPAKRPLGDRKLALVRFVCLEMSAESTWRERFAEWNTRHPGSGESYATARAMQNAFRKAERSLVGHDGLRWYYDAEYREAWRRALAQQLEDLGGAMDEALAGEAGSSLADAMSALLGTPLKGGDDDESDT